MADSKSPEAKTSDTKTGPVKPPVLDLKAREASKTAASSKPAADASAKEQAAKPEPTKEDPKPAVFPIPDSTVATPRAGFPIGATIGGGALGLVAAYGLAWLGLWPVPQAPAPQADPRLAQFASAIPELETVTQTTQSELAALNRRIAAIEADVPETTEAAAPVDLGTIEGDIAALSARLDALPSAPDDAGAVTALQTEFAALTSRLDELGARLGTAEASLRTIDGTVTATSAALASQPGDIGAVLQLPLVLSGLETAFANGRPFETELAALRSAVPTATIPGAIANAAGTGLPRPDLVAQRFTEVLPDMIGRRPADPNAQWQDGALDWFRSAIALRSTGEIEGDTPDAVLSQLEAAVARRDFTTADGLLAKLPEPMKSAAGDVAGQISALAAAANFIETVRASALSGEALQ